MTPILTVEANPIPWEWSTQTNNLAFRSDPATANVAAILLGGLWRGHKIEAADIEQARKELWSGLEAGE
mgnify:CR=1